MSAPPIPDVAGKYLTFRLAEENYGLQILKVQEIIGMMIVTRVPRTPPFIRGVINLRGKVIPVVDLRAKFGLPEQAETEVSCIIVVQVNRGDDTVVMGIIVDEVSEVLDVKADQVEPPPSFGEQIDTAFILGIGKIADRVIMLLDSDQVLSTDDVVAIADMAE